MTQPIAKNHYNKTYLVLAQSIGLMVCLFFIFFIIGAELPDIMKGKGDDFLKTLPLILLPIAGYFIAWFKEKIGAMILVAGGIFLLVYFLIAGEIVKSLEFSLPFILTGFLFLLHIKKRNELKTKK